MTDQHTTLTHLIDICKDAKNFYEYAAEKTQDKFIQSVFRNMAYIRGNIIADLEDYMRASGGKPEDHNGTVKGKATQFYQSLVSRLSSDSDANLVTHLEEAEDRTLEEFHDAMALNIPMGAKAVLSQQLNILHDTHDYMKKLKTHMQADEHSEERFLQTA